MWLTLTHCWAGYEDDELDSVDSLEEVDEDTVGPIANTPARFSTVVEPSPARLFGFNVSMRWSVQAITPLFVTHGELILTESHLEFVRREEEGEEGEEEKRPNTFHVPTPRVLDDSARKMYAKSIQKPFKSRLIDLSAITAVEIRRYQLQVESLYALLCRLIAVACQSRAACCCGGVHERRLPVLLQHDVVRCSSGAVCGLAQAQAKACQCGNTGEGTTCCIQSHYFIDCVVIARVCSCLTCPAL